MPNQSFPQTFTLRLAAETASALEDLIVQTVQRGGNPDRIVGIRMDETNLSAQIKRASSVRDAEQIVLYRRQALRAPRGAMLSTSFH